MAGFSADYFKNYGKKSKTSEKNKGFTADYFKNYGKNKPKETTHEVASGELDLKTLKNKPKEIKPVKTPSTNQGNGAINIDPKKVINYPKDTNWIEEKPNNPVEGAIYGGLNLLHKVPGLGNAMDFVDRTGKVATNAFKTSMDEIGGRDPRKNPDIIKPKSTGNKIADGVADVAGEIGSFFISPAGPGASLGSVGIKTGNAVKNLISPKLLANPKVAKVLPRLIEGQVAGGTTSVLNDALKGHSIEETAKNAAIGAAIGGAADLGIAGLGKLAKGAIKSTVNESSLGLKSPNKTYITPKTKAIRETNALNDYYNDIDMKDYINSNDPAYIKAENALRAKQGLKPLEETKPSLPTKKIENPLISVKKGKPLLPGNLDMPKSEVAATSEAFNIPPTIEIPQPRNGLKVVESPMPESVPQNVGTKERGFNKTLSNDSNVNEELRQSIKDEPFTYDPITNKDTFEEAQKDFDKGFDNAKIKFEQTNMAKNYNPKDVVLGEMLIKHAADTGNIQQAREITGQLAEKLTEAGQFIQAAKILRKADPEGFMVYVQRELNKVNQEGSKTFGKKWNPIELTDDEITSIGNMRNMADEEKQAFQEQLYNGIAQRVPATNMEKVNAWRRLAMLFNPLTHIRNVVGNGLFAPLRKTSDALASGFEKLTLPKNQRTKSIGWSFDSNLKSIVDKDWETTGKELANNSNRWELSQVLNREKRIFKNNTLEKINKFSGKSLESEDIPFLKNAYKDALGGYMKAQGLTEVNQTARDYASRRALEATYKDMNKFSELITAMKRKSGIFGEAILPFAKTPSNLSVRAFEHSPYGLITELGKAAWQVKNDTFNPTKFIEQISKGITGTVALTGLGFGLAHAGVITGSTSTDKDQAAFDKENGKLPYAIKIGGKYFTYDFAQPVALPLAMGAEIYNKIKDKSDAVDVAYSSMIAGGDTLFNSSMLKSIKAVFGGTYSSPTEAIANTMMNFPKQAVPSLGGQISRSWDPYERDISASNPIDALKNYGKSRTPELSKTLPKKINTRGEEVKTDGMGNRVLQNMILPFKVGEPSSNPVDKLIQDAYDETNNKNVFPKVAPKELTYKKVKYELNAQEKNDFQKIMGQETYKKIEPLLKSNAPMKKKAKIIENIIDNAYDKAKSDFLKHKREGK